MLYAFTALCLLSNSVRSQILVISVSRMLFSLYRLYQLYHKDHSSSRLECYTCMSEVYSNLKEIRSRCVLAFSKLSIRLSFSFLARDNPGSAVPRSKPGNFVKAGMLQDRVVTYVYLLCRLTHAGRNDVD